MTAPSTPADIVRLASEAINLDRKPGYRAFTNGIVTPSHNEDGHLVIATDNRWAASAIRSRLRQAGCAVEGDPLNESVTVTVWPIGRRNNTELPVLQMTERQEAAGTVLVLEGPDGAVEQQCGSGGHNDLIVHARHPFRGAASVSCDQHAGTCWSRSNWPWRLDVRRFVSQSYEANGFHWRPNPKAVWRMRSIYQVYIHQTRAPALGPPGGAVDGDQAQLALALFEA